MLKKSLTLFAVVVLNGACASDSSGPGGIRLVVITAPFTTLEAGQGVQLTATATDASGSVVPNVAWTWSSATQSVATVDGTGLVSTLTGGQATIMASAQGVEGSLGLTITAGPGGVATVSMPGDVFVPFTTTISVGNTVQFEFPAVPHNVIFASLAGAPTDIQASAGRTVPRVFLVAGTFAYDCTLHPGMRGEVVVR